MKNTEKYRYWLMLSDYDIGTVPCLIGAERWVYVAYLCQQSVERQLKGMYVYYYDKEAPKTHNVNFLFKKISESPLFSERSADSMREGLYDDYVDFMVDLMFYYMSDYPFSYKNIRDRFIDRDCALDLFDKTRQCLAWLRGFQESVGDTAALIEDLTGERTGS